MTIGQLSDTSMVLAAVGYLVAFALHSIEWAAARDLAGERPADGSEDARRIRVDMFGRLAVAATVVSAFLHILAVVTRGLAAERYPWGNMYEFISSALAFAVIIYLVGVWRWKMRWLGPGVMLTNVTTTSRSPAPTDCRRSTALW